MTGAMEGNPPAELPSLGGSLAVSLLSLGLVCLLAWVALRWLSRRGWGPGWGRCGWWRAAAGAQPLRVPDRGRRTLLPGGRRRGADDLLAEVDPKAVPLPPRPQPLLGSTLRFGDILARLRSGQPLKQPVPASPPATDGDHS